MTYYIKRLPGDVNPNCPRPYFAGFGSGTLAPRQAFWKESREDAEAYSTRNMAFLAAHVWGPNWRDLVRVVRVRSER